jgi:hypothetical protein
MLSLVHPLNCSKQITREVHQEKQELEAEKRQRRFEIGDKILYRDVLHKRWKKGTVREVSNVQYEITTDEGTSVRKHVDHVVSYNQGKSVELRGKPDIALEHSFTEYTRPETPTIDVGTPPLNDIFSDSRRASIEVRIPTQTTEQASAQVRRAEPSTLASDRPRRDRRAPDRLNL